MADDFGNIHAAATRLKTDEARALAQKALDLSAAISEMYEAQTAKMTDPSSMPQELRDYDAVFTEIYSALAARLLALGIIQCSRSA